MPDQREVVVDKDVVFEIGGIHGTLRPGRYPVQQDSTGRYISVPAITRLSQPTKVSVRIKV